MQISFSRQETYVPEWKGNKDLPEAEQFTVDLTLLTVEDLLFLLDAFSEAGIEGQVEVDLGLKELKPIVKTNGHLLPKYVIINNLRNEAGVEITINDVVEFPYFLSLAAELLMKLADASNPSDDDTKNSNALPVSEPTL